MLRRYRSTLIIVAGFFIGLFLQSFDKLLPHNRSQSGAVPIIAKIVDWTAPPLAGALLAAALLVGQRYKRLHEAERAASRVLAERLTGIERRQAIWVVAAAIAHDLKNPLHNLQLLMEELDEEREPGRRAELLRRLRDNVARASEKRSQVSAAARQSGGGAAGSRRLACAEHGVDTASVARSCNTRSGSCTTAERAASV